MELLVQKIEINNKFVAYGTIDQKTFFTQALTLKSLDEKVIELMQEHSKKNKKINN